MEPVSRSDLSHSQDNGLPGRHPATSALPTGASNEINLSMSRMPPVSLSEGTLDPTISQSQTKESQTAEQHNATNGFTTFCQSVTDIGTSIMMAGSALSVGTAALYTYFKMNVMESVWDASNPELARQESMTMMLIVGGLFAISLAGGGSVALAGKGLEMAGRGVKWVREKMGHLSRDE